MSAFPERLRALRKAKGFSQQGLADQLRISKSNINMYERGEREPPIARLELFADYFNVDMNYLLGLTDIPNQYQQSLDRSALSSLVDDARARAIMLLAQLTPEEFALVDAEIQRILAAREHGE